jgi:hypothetical protein
MRKIIFFLSLAISLSMVTSAQTKITKNDTKPLPDCVVIKNGKLQAKPGYTVAVSTDGKTFTVSNAKGIGGTFSCSCNSATGNCGALVGTAGVYCDGSCDKCSITVIISGTKYTVDLSAAVLRKS